MFKPLALTSKNRGYALYPFALFNTKINCASVDYGVYCITTIDLTLAKSIRVLTEPVTVVNLDLINICFELDSTRALQPFSLPAHLGISNVRLHTSIKNVTKNIANAKSLYNFKIFQ